MSGPHYFAVRVRRASSRAPAASTASHPASPTLRNAPQWDRPDRYNADLGLASREVLKIRNRQNKYESGFKMSSRESTRDSSARATTSTTIRSFAIHLPSRMNRQVRSHVVDFAVNCNPAILLLVVLGNLRHRNQLRIAFSSCLHLSQIAIQPKEISTAKPFASLLSSLWTN